MASFVFFGTWVMSLGPIFGQTLASQTLQDRAFLFLSFSVYFVGKLCVMEKNTHEGSFPEGDQVHSSAK